MLLCKLSSDDAQPAAAFSDRDRRIRAEQARLIWKSPLPQLANAVNAAFVFGVVWYLTRHGELLGLVALMMAVVWLRIRLWRS